MQAKGFFIKRCPVHNTRLVIGTDGLMDFYQCPTCISIYKELVAQGVSPAKAKSIAQGGNT